MAFDLTGYVDVAERISLFREKYPEGSLQAEVIHWPELEGGLSYIAVKAYAYRTEQDQRPGTGLAWEDYPGKTPYTKGSELQNAETSAWGRAIVAVLAADTKRGDHIASRQEVERTQQAKPTMGDVFKKPKPDPDLASDPDSTSASELPPGVKKVVPDLAAKYPYIPKDCPHLRWNESPTNSKFEICPGCGSARKKGEVSV